MIFDCLTLFPEMYDVFKYSIIKRAIDNGLLEINLYNIRDYTTNKHNKVDDYPYGGGSGMVMQPEPIYNAVDHIISKYGYKPYTVLMSPRGVKFTQKEASTLVNKDHVMIICGHYEGIDERIMPLVDCEMSIGDFVLTGGELASMTIIDAVSRLVPGVLASSDSYEDESHYSGLLEYPQYTRPEEFRGMRVPDVLLSGHHENIRKWRRYQSLKITKNRRPDMIKALKKTKEDIKMLSNIDNEESSGDIL